MFGIIGKIVTVPGGRDDLAAILSGIGQMPGCNSYVVATVPDEPDTLWVTEVWESAEAHTASLGIPAVQEAIAAGRPLIVGFESRVETQPITGIPLSD